MRNLLILIVGIIIFWWLRRSWENVRRRGQTAGSKTAKAARAENMLECEYCKIHVPEGEGVRQGEHFFCCDEHRRLIMKR